MREYLDRAVECATSADNFGVLPDRALSSPQLSDCPDNTSSASHVDSLSSTSLDKHSACIADVDFTDRFSHIVVPTIVSNRAWC